MTFKTPQKILILLSLLFLLPAAAEIDVEDLDTKYSEYLAAIYARQIGDVDRAKENYLRVIKKDPENVKILEEAYTYFIYVGDYKQALDIAKALQELDDQHSSSAMLLALDAFKRGRDKDLELYLTKAKGLGFDLLMGPLMEAWLLADDGKVDEALLKIAPLQNNPGFEPFQAEHRAFMLDKGGRKKEAETAYLALLARAEITSLQPLLAYGAFLQKLGRQDEALDLYKEFQPSAPTNLQLQKAIQSLEDGKKIEGLVDDPRKAVSMAMLRAGVELTREQAYYPGIIYARFAIFLNPDFDEAQLFLGNMLSSETFPDLALEAYRKVDPDGPFGETALLRQALVYSFFEDDEAAISLVENYLADHHESADAYMTLGDLYRAKENYADALPNYEKAIELIGELTDEDWFLLFTRAICYERLDMWAEAEADFLKVLEMRPDEPDVLNYLGYSWIDQGMNLKEGRAMIEKAVAARPDSGYIVDSLGWAQYLMGEYEEAVINLEQAVALEPGDPTINEHLGDAYWKVGREREARFQWDHALNLDPEADVAAKLEQKLADGLVDEAADDNL